VLRVTGEDAFSFLQGQFSNDLRQAIGTSTYGLWLNQKGKVVADSWVLREAESEFLLVSIESTAESIRSRLEAYVVADEVAVADESDNFSGLAVGGAEAIAKVRAVIGALPEAGRFVAAGGAHIFRGRRSRAESLELIGPAAGLGEWSRALRQTGVGEIAPAAAERGRIAAGIPAIPRDLGPADLPNEGGLDEGAISYTKGCYLGQEVMARLKNLGQVRRRLRILRGSGAAPAPKAPLFQGATQVGEIRSAATGDEGYVALAMLSLVNLDPQAGLALAAGAPATLTLEAHD